MDVGFIGLGNMGFQMARNLLKAGHALRVYNRTSSRAEKAQSLRRHRPRLPRATLSSPCLRMAVEETVSGENGVLKGLKPGAAHISSSTITVALSERLKRAHAEAKQTYISAPVFGRPKFQFGGPH